MFLTIKTINQQLRICF